MPDSGARVIGKVAALRVASYNIHRAVGSDRRQDRGRIAAVIAELRADIVGLQEVDWHHDHEDEESQFEYLAHLPGYRAIAGPNIRDHRGHYGNLLLTRLPLGVVRRVDLPQVAREPRGALDVDLEVGDRLLRVIVTHLGLGLGERRRQAARLRALLLARPDDPTLLLGDFNEWLPGAPSLRPLSALCGTARHPASYPAFRPLLALDRILVRGLPALRDLRAHRSPLARRASDHLPVVGELATAAPDSFQPDRSSL